MLVKILLGLVAVLVVFLIVAALQPADFRITRSIAIGATPAAIFARVNDLHQWQEFSPWAKLDPTMKTSYEGPVAGVGAGYSWAGNSKVGEGRMTITESRPVELVRLKLEFLKPMAATNTCDFTFTPEGDQTRVTWTMFGKNNLMAKAFNLVMNMDSLVGPDFEKGLANLKVLSEGARK